MITAKYEIMGVAQLQILIYIVSDSGAQPSNSCRRYMVQGRVGMMNPYEFDAPCAWAKADDKRYWRRCFVSNSIASNSLLINLLITS